MATLHLVNRSADQSPALGHCLARAGEDDAVLLIEDGVYAAVKAPALPAGVRLYVLQPDLEARGLGVADLAPGIRPVDHAGFVALTVRYPRSLSWF